LPVDLTRKAVYLYDKGVDASGKLGFKYKGREVSLRAIAEESELRLTAFFGSQDKLVQSESGQVMSKILGSRYRQVNHANAAHVSYVCFPSQWNKASPMAFQPNPVDVLVEEYGANALT
jgi:hypothetical protein